MDSASEGVLRAGLQRLRGRSVFVTGHTGFKGSWLSYWLLRCGAKVTGYALEPPSTPSLFEALALAKHIESIHGDVRDLTSLARQMEASKCDIVVHMAAQSLVRASYADPVGTYGTNVMGTVNVLEAARKCDTVKAVVIVTTDKCYENLEWTWPYREDDRLGGRDPYASSKACAELVTTAYRQSFFASGKGIASVRAGNVIGGGDWAADRLIPDLVRAFVTRTPAIIRRPRAIRPWQHVLEPLSGYILVADRLITQPERVGEAWNFGPRLEDSQSVGWVADRFTSVLGPNAKWATETSDDNPHEAGILRLDWTKAHVHLDWTPRWTLHTALTRTAAWYREYYASKLPSEIQGLCDADIQAFESSVSPHVPSAAQA